MTDLVISDRLERVAALRMKAALLVLAKYRNRIQIGVVLIVGAVEQKPIAATAQMGKSRKRNICIFLKLLAKFKPELSKRLCIFRAQNML